LLLGLLGHAAFFLLRLLLAFVFRHDFNGGLFSRLCILLFSLGFGQDAVTERLDRSILRRDEKKASSSAHTRRSLLGVASSRATSRVASKRANSDEKNILLFDTHRDVLLHFVRVHLENNENRFRQSSLNRVERMHRTC
jgi:predicted secreted Zn-dependent protease